MKRIILIVLFVALIVPGLCQETRAPSPFVDNQSEEEHRLRYRQRFVSQFQTPYTLSEEARLAFVINKYRDLTVYDTKTVLFEVAAEKDGDALKLAGEVMFPQHKRGIQELFENLGYKTILNSIKVLPEDAQIGTLDYALVTTYTARIDKDYSNPRSILDEALYGQYLRLLKSNPDGTHYLVQIPNGYVGWTSADSFMKISHKQWQQRMTHSPKAMILEGVVFADRSIPRGAVLPLIKQESDSVTLLCPGDDTIKISTRKIQIIKPDLTASRNKILSISKDLMGLRYKWAGFSDKGYDCSGFSRIIYQTAGVYLPRDADQQSAVGEIVSFRNNLEELLPGDLLFFCSSNGRIGHVAISLGGTEIIHSSRPDIHINSLDPDDPRYDEHYREAFAFARRIFIAGY